MSRLIARVAAAALALACLFAAGGAAGGAATAAVGAGGPPVATDTGGSPAADAGAAAPAAHSFVQFNVSELRTEPGGTVAAAVTFHNAYGARLVVAGPDGFRYGADVGPSGGVRLTVRLDTAAAGRGQRDAVAVVGGVAGNVTVSGAPGEPLPAGVYNVSLYTGDERRDSVALRVGAAEGTAPAAPRSPSAQDASATAEASGGARSSTAGTATSAGAGAGFGAGPALAALAALTALLALAAASAGRER